MKDDRISNWFTTGTAVERPKEGTLFYEAVIEPRRDVDHAGNEAQPPETRPNLTLVREDDDLEESILRDHADPLDAETAMFAEREPVRSEDDEHDAWPWDDEVESSKVDVADAIDDSRLPVLTVEPIETPPLHPSSAPVNREHDHSASEDVILCEPQGILYVEETAETEESEMPLAAASDIVEVASAYGLRAGSPKRIGSGQLVPARLTWRPGDPFGGDVSGKLRFRWEVMLTSACVTAACGLGCIWLLRTLLA